MYEQRRRRPISRRQFAWRLGKHIALASSLAIVSLGAGMAGYKYFQGLSWLESFVNAAMILSGMGPMTDELKPEAQLFAGIYALYSGLVFLVATGIILVPILHRLLHRFHWDEEETRRT